MSRFGRLLGSLLLLGVVSLLLLLAGEATVRGLELHGSNFVRPDRWTGWVHEPGAKGLYVSSQAKAFVEYNSLGLRGPEIAQEKPPGVRRLLLLGDSFTESEQVPYAETWGARLEGLLGPGWQTLNAGVAGYGTDNALLWLRRYGWALQPDAVLLLFFTGNDVSDNDAPLGRQTGTWLPQPVFRLAADGSGPEGLVLGDHPLPEHRPGPLGRIKDTLRRRSRLYLFVRDSFFELRARRAQAPSGAGAVPRAWHVYRTEVDEDWHRAWELTERLLAAMAGDCREHGSPFSVALLPTGWRIDPGQRSQIGAQYPELVSGPGWQLDLPDRRVEAILAELGVPSLDLAPSLESAAAASPQPLYGDHLTARGHAIVASSLAAFLPSVWTAAGTSPDAPNPELAEPETPGEDPEDEGSQRNVGSDASH